MAHSIPRSIHFLHEQLEVIRRELIDLVKTRKDILEEPTTVDIHYEDESGERFEFPQCILDKVCVLIGEDFNLLDYAYELGRALDVRIEELAAKETQGVVEHSEHEADSGSENGGPTLH